MSWNVSFLSRAAFESDKPNSSSPAIDEIRGTPIIVQQYIIARQAAELMLSRPGILPRGGETPEDTEGWTRSLPDATVEYSVHLSGHANPNHRPAAGWANDGITVAVHQINSVEAHNG